MFFFFVQCTLLVSFVRHLLFSVLFLSSAGRMFSLFLSLFFFVLLHPSLSVAMFLSPGSTSSLELFS